MKRFIGEPAFTDIKCADTICQPLQDPQHQQSKHLILVNIIRSSVIAEIGKSFGNAWYLIWAETFIWQKKQFQIAQVFVRIYNQK